LKKKQKTNDKEGVASGAQEEKTFTAAEEGIGHERETSRLRVPKLCQSVFAIG